MTILFTTALPKFLGSESCEASAKVYIVLSHLLYGRYRVTLVVAYLGWVDIDLNVPPSCTASQSNLSNPYLPKQNLTDSGMTKITFNPTQVGDHQSHPVT